MTNVKLQLAVDVNIESYIEGGQMKRIKLLLQIFLLIMGASMLMGQTLYPARAQGFGGAFTAISDDASALSWNPAGLDIFKEDAVLLHYNALNSGFSDDNMHVSSVGFVYHLPQILSFGISNDMINTDIYDQNIVGFNISKKLSPKFSTGVRLNILSNTYDKSNFIYGEDDNSEDPVFDANGYSNISVSADIGFLIFPVKEVTLGLFIKNIVSPNLELNNTDGKEFKRFRTGAAYTYKENYIFSLEGEFLSKKVGKSAFRTFLGTEAWYFDRSLALRSGYNKDQLSFGAQYRTYSFAIIDINYTFVYPLSKLADEGAYSHKFTLAFGYIPME
jgi:hypothetical protein